MKQHNGEDSLKIEPFGPKSVFGAHSLASKIDWKDRLIGIIGARGTGKTTLLLQHLKQQYGLAGGAVYITLDDIYFTENRLSDFAEAFRHQGGKMLYIDEVHKYPDWAREVKNTYDFYKDLRIVFTGSSIMDMPRQNADLSRRAVQYELPGLSFREYLQFTGIYTSDSLTLDNILRHHVEIVSQIAAAIKPLQFFDQYLQSGYYPFFLESKDSYSIRVEQMVKMIIETDIRFIDGFDPSNTRKIYQLLYILATNVPFKPNISKLSEKNPLIINPAYAGSNNMFNANLQYRTQWAGIDANPSTVNFSSHMSVYQNKVGVGLMVIEDKLGDQKNTEFNTLYSYKLKLNNSTLSFGMQTGFIRYTNNPEALTIRDGGDPAFNAYSETKFNTGAGLLLKSDRYMIGLSVPRLLPATVSQGGQAIQLYSQNYYLFGSYLMFISQNLRFKPSLLLRGTKGSPFSADMNASFNFKEFYTAGIFTRNFKSYGLLMQAMVKSFRIGYVFELPGSSASSLNFTSHEIMLGISIGLLSNHDRTVKTF